MSGWFCSLLSGLASSFVTAPHQVIRSVGRTCVDVAVHPSCLGQGHVMACESGQLGLSIGLGNDDSSTSVRGA